MSRESYARRADLSRCSCDTHDRPKTHLPQERRAELEEQTRLRITESAVALHEELGPARTSISAVAEHAGVRRSTVYRHFPDEEALFAACSSHFRRRTRRRTRAPGRPSPTRRERTAVALRELYAYYGRTEEMYASLLRDEPLVPIVQRRLAGFYGYLRAIEDADAGRGLRGSAAVGRARRSATRSRSRPGARWPSSRGCPRARSSR